MALRRVLPSNSSLAAIFDMAKSAWLSTTPLELMRIKISVTVSISRSAASSIRPICFLVMSHSLSNRSYTRSASASGLWAMYSGTNL
ncbi:hypothetical protein D3C85_1702240 [compost metagenome]